MNSNRKYNILKYIKIITAYFWCARIASSMLNGPQGEQSPIGNVIQFKFYKVIIRGKY